MGASVTEGAITIEEEKRCFEQAQSDLVSCIHSLKVFKYADDSVCKYAESIAGIISDCTDSVVITESEDLSITSAAAHAAACVTALSLVVMGGSDKSKEVLDAMDSAMTLTEYVNDIVIGANIAKAFIENGAECMCDSEVSAKVVKDVASAVEATVVAVATFTRTSDTFFGMHEVSPPLPCVFLRRDFYASVMPQFFKVLPRSLFTGVKPAIEAVYKGRHTNIGKYAKAIGYCIESIRALDILSENATTLRLMHDTEATLAKTAVDTFRTKWLVGCTDVVRRATLPILGNVTTVADELCWHCQINDAIGVAIVGELVAASVL